MYMHTLMIKRKQPPRKSLVTDARAAIAACAGLNSRLAARRITQFLEHRIAGTGLSLAQFGLMAHVAAAADDTLAALTERTGLDQTNPLAQFTGSGEGRTGRNSNRRDG